MRAGVLGPFAARSEARHGDGREGGAAILQSLGWELAGRTVGLVVGGMPGRAADKWGGGGWALPTVAGTVSRACWTHWPLRTHSCRGGPTPGPRTSSLPCTRLQKSFPTPTYRPGHNPRGGHCNGQRTNRRRYQEVKARRGSRPWRRRRDTWTGSLGPRAGNDPESAGGDLGESGGSRGGRRCPLSPRGAHSPLNSLSS